MRNEVIYMKQQHILSMIFVAILIGGIGFFAGMQYQKMQRGQMIEQLSGGRTQMQGGQGRMVQKNGQSPVLGEITSQDDTSLTVKLPDGSSKIVILSQTTAINKQAAGSIGELKIGENIMVVGSSNADGSVTAQNIQLNQQIRGLQKATPSGNAN